MFLLEMFIFDLSSPNWLLSLLFVKYHLVLMQDKFCWNDPHFCWNNPHFQKQLIFFGHTLTFLIVGFVSKPRIPMKHSILCHIPNTQCFVVGCLISHLRRSISQLIGGFNLKNMRIITPFIGKTTAYIRPPTTQFSWPIDPNFVCGILQLVALRLSLWSPANPRTTLAATVQPGTRTRGNPWKPCRGFLH